MKYVKKIVPFFIDDRGEMSHLIDGKADITSILLITSQKGSIRANHYHKKDIHYVYLLKGKLEYSYQDLKKKSSKKRTLIIDEGSIIKTPQMTAHAMRFLEDSVFLAFSILLRDRKNYENDTVSIEFVG